MINSEFFNAIGKLALGTRLRFLSESIMEEAAQLYELYGVDLQPKWFPVFYVLSQKDDRTVTEIAKEIGHTHPSVSKLVKEMMKEDLLQEQRDQLDGRRNLIRLSSKGKKIMEKIAPQYTDVNQAIEEILQQSNHNLWHAMEEFEFLLNQKSLFRRVMEQKKKRESKNIQIVDFEPSYKKAFKDLNLEWIERYFEVEETDIQSLEHPESYILDKGGCILFALLEGEVLGVCALIPMDDPEFDYELAKMAVSPKAQGKGIGFLIGKAILEKAKSLGAKKVYLESNTKLTPAINLYHKLGFEKIAGRPTPYERCNIQMAIYF